MLLMTRTKVKPEAAAAVEAAGRRLFAALEQVGPGNVRCVSSKLSDGVTFVTLLHVDDGTENPLPALPAFRELQELLRDSMVEPPVAGPATVVGDYRLLAPRRGSDESLR
jgi:hypothetical protein